MDALRHANMGGVSSKGGMILAVAEDPIGKSSTLAYQSEQSLISAGIPVFYPANVNEVISMGLQAFALSRHAGICVGLKITGDTADSNAVIDMGLIRPKILKPDNPNNVHVNRHDPALDREAALINRRIPASKDFIAKNNINEIHHRQPVIINQTDVNRYLNLELQGSAFLNECSKPDLIFHEVSKDVNKPTNNTASLIQKVSNE